MDIRKIKSISKIKKPNNNFGKIDFSKLNINENKIHYIKVTLINILEQFNNYADYFEFLPIEFHFSKLLAKYQRFKVF